MVGIVSWAAPGPLRVIVDTDAGSDDVMAIAFLLAHTGVRIEAITVANGLAHVEPGARNMARLAATARAAIPVYAGRRKPLAGSNEFPREWRRQSDGLMRGPGGAQRRVETRGAAEFLAEYLRGQGAGSVTILALGPLTNLAEAFERAPAARAAVREIVIMGGAVRVPGNLGDGGYFKTANRTAEWNIFVDPVAAARVFASGVALRVVPLDATNQVPVTMEFLESFRKRARAPLARVVAQVLESDRSHIQGGYFYAWDPLAAVALIEPQVLATERLHIEVRTSGAEEGRTAEVATRSANATVATGANGALFREVFFRVLTP
jgi:pyrimidine-specific ribonucleoside hydrolase